MGSQRCRGTIPAFVPKPTKASRKIAVRAPGASTELETWRLEKYRSRETGRNAKNKESPLETSPHQVARNLREIESALRAVLGPLAAQPEHPSKRGHSGDEGHKAEIRDVLRGLGIAETDRVAEVWLKLPRANNEYGLHVRAHRDSLAPPQLVPDEFRTSWIEIEAILDVVLDKLESRYLEFHQTLDELLAKPSSTQADIDVLRNHVPNNLVTHGYFFQRRSELGWLEPLATAGFFKDPPKPIQEDRGINFAL